MQSRVWVLHMRTSDSKTCSVPPRYLPQFVHSLTMAACFGRRQRHVLYSVSQFFSYFFLSSGGVVEREGIWEGFCSEVRACSSCVNVCVRLMLSVRNRRGETIHQINPLIFRDLLIFLTRKDKRLCNILQSVFPVLACCTRLVSAYVAVGGVCVCVCV